VRTFPATELSTRAAATRRWYDGLGCEQVEVPGAVVRRQPDLPTVWDANHLVEVQACEPDEIVAVEAAAAEAVGFAPHKVVADVDTPEPYVAHLVLEGYSLDLEVEMVLAGPLRLDRVPDGAVTPIEGEEDWADYAELVRLDGAEQAARTGGEPWGEGIAEAITAFRRAKSPEVRHWGARCDGELAAFFSSAAGVDGMGVVEHLFTRKDHRGRGIAAALMARAVEDARERGAHEVLIGARVDDTPMHWYRRLGFEPVRLHRMWLR
jgi:GNAT superfamily N-acetyltransferase